MKLDILVGDDLFGWPVFGEQALRIVETIREKLHGYEIALHTECLPDRVVREATHRQYDVVVTDLDYEHDGSRREGYGVIDKVSALTPKSLLVLCTSSDRIDRTRIDGKVDYLVTEGERTKFDELVDCLTKHYSK